MAAPAPHHIPEGLQSITPYLWFTGECRAAMAFYERVFDAQVCGTPVTQSDSQALMHVLMRVGDSAIMMADAPDGAWEQGPVDHVTASLWLYVKHCDEVFTGAVDAGCQILMPLMDAFWGDRFGKVKDPFGHCWAIASCKEVLSSEESEERLKDWVQSSR